MTWSRTSALELVAQFDKVGSVFVDNKCETDPTFVVGTTCADTVQVDIVDPFVQFPTGGVVLLGDGSTLVTVAEHLLSLGFTSTITGISFTLELGFVEKHGNVVQRSFSRERLRCVAA